MRWELGAITVQFYIETRNSLGGYNSNFLCLKYEGIDNVGFLPPTILNIERRPLARGYNSKFSYLESV